MNRFTSSDSYVLDTISTIYYYIGMPVPKSTVLKDPSIVFGFPSETPIDVVDKHLADTKTVIDSLSELDELAALFGDFDSEDYEEEDDDLDE